AARPRGHDRGAGGAQQPLGLVQRLLPAERLEAARADLAQRILDAVVGAQMPEGKPALVAEPALVDLRVVAGENPLDLALARGRADVAADRAEPADGRHVLDLPGARLEAVLRRRERPDRAELDHVAGERCPVRLRLQGPD